MSRKLQLVPFAAGAAVFAYLVARIGVATLVADALRTGWLFVPVVLVYGVVCCCSACAWRLSMAGEPRRPPLWRTWAITVAGSALNFMTPLVNVGGEPFKIAAASAWLGARRAAGSALIHRMVHTLGMVVSLLTAVVLGAFLLPHHAGVLAGLAVAFAVLVGLSALLLQAHRRGGLEHALNVMQRVPVLAGLARRLEPRRATLGLMDGQITEFYHRCPGRFFRALELEYLGRAMFMLEYVIIGLGVGLHVTYPQAYVIGGLTSLIQNATFFVPFEAGTKEGSLYLLFQLLGFDPALGVYTAIVSRLRDMAWIGAGLALVWLSSPPGPLSGQGVRT